MNNPVLIPDWEQPTFITLVWPFLIPSKRDGLLDFYKSFIDLILEHCPEQHLLILTLPEGMDMIRDTFRTERVHIESNLNIQDIWVRDYAPFWKRQGRTSIPVKAKYAPSCQGIKRSFYENEVGKSIAGTDEAMNINGFDVILDGGNLTHNGAGKAIMTYRFIGDNEHIFIDALISGTKEYFGFSDLILVPAEYGDKTGHVDGMARFLSEQKVIVSDYSYDWENKRYYINEEDYLLAQKQMKNLADYLFKQGFDITRMPNGIPMKGGEIGSAVGNYMNFLRIGEKFFLPQYGNDEQDRWAINALLIAGIDNQNIIPVPDCNALAKLGGVLNCITSHMYFDLGYLQDIRL